MRRAPSFDDAQKGRGRDGDGETATEGTGLDDQSDAAAGPGLPAAAAGARGGQERIPLRSLCREHTAHATESRPPEL